jgi:hypothetical protein
MARENMARDALKIAADFDYTIIDGPPQAETISRFGVGPGGRPDRAGGCLALVVGLDRAPIERKR